MATVSATIEELKQQTVADNPAGSIHAQVDEVTSKWTKDQKPYLEIHLRDATANFPLRVWSDHPSFGFCSELRAGDFVEIQGDFMVSAAFGLEARNWSVRFLTVSEKADLLAFLDLLLFWRQNFLLNLHVRLHVNRSMPDVMAICDLDNPCRIRHG